MQVEKNDEAGLNTCAPALGLNARGWTELNVHAAGDGGGKEGSRAMMIQQAEVVRARSSLSSVSRVLGPPPSCNSKYCLSFTALKKGGALFICYAFG